MMIAGLAGHRVIERYCLPYGFSKVYLVKVNVSRAGDSGHPEDERRDKFIIHPFPP